MQRVTAAWVAKGLGGWNFRPVVWSERNELTLMVMTVQQIRPDGHIGMVLLLKKNGKTQLVHASSRKGFVAVDVDENHPLVKVHTILRQTTK